MCVCLSVCMCEWGMRQVLPGCCEVALESAQHHHLSSCSSSSDVMVSLSTCTHTDDTHCFGRMLSLSLSHFLHSRAAALSSRSHRYTHTYAHNEECMVCEYLEQICVFIQLQTGKPRVRYFSLDFDFEFDLLNISQTNIQIKYMQTNINKPRFNSSVFYR